MEGRERVSDDEERFVETCAIEHDRDPGAWHRAMLTPPAPRSESCAFCGLVWPQT